MTDEELKPLSDADLTAWVIRGAQLKNNSLSRPVITLAKEVDRLQVLADNLNDENARLRAENHKLVALVKEFADHAADSGWPSTAKELRDRLRAAIEGK